MLLLITQLHAADDAVSIGKPAPDFSLSNHDKTMVHLSEHRGHIVVLEWINGDCPFVRSHYSTSRQTMLKLASQFKGDGVAWFAINSTHLDDLKRNEEIAKDYNIPYPVLDDHDGKVGRAYGARTTPQMFIIDKDGRLAYRGAIDDDPDGSPKVNYVEQALKQLIAGKPVSTPETRPYGCAVKYGP
jgi:peroxiredoxin